MPTDVSRTRTIHWEDPVTNAAAARTLSGLEFLQRIIDGRLPRPPIAEVLGFSLVEAQEGRAVFEIVPREFHYNPIGRVHGGVAATLLDSVLGCAVQSLLPAGVGYTTLEIKVNLTRAITVDRPPARNGHHRARRPLYRGGRGCAPRRVRKALHPRHHHLPGPATGVIGAV